MKKENFYWEGAFGKIKFKAHRILVPFMFIGEAFLSLVWAFISIFFIIPIESRLKSYNQPNNETKK